MFVCAVCVPSLFNDYDYYYHCLVISTKSIVLSNLTAIMNKISASTNKIGRFTCNAALQNYI